MVKIGLDTSQEWLDRFRLVKLDFKKKHEDSNLSILAASVKSEITGWLEWTVSGKLTPATLSMLCSSNML